jgi:hypothetical protein
MQVTAQVRWESGAMIDKIQLSTSSGAISMSIYNM